MHIFVNDTAALELNNESGDGGWKKPQFCEKQWSSTLVYLGVDLYVR